MKHVTPCSMIPPPTSSTPSPFSDPASCPVVCSFARTWSMQQSLTTRPLHVLTPDSLPDIHGYLMQVTLTASGQSITCALSYARATPLTSLWLSNLLSDRLLPLPPPFPILSVFAAFPLCPICSSGISVAKWTCSALCKVGVFFCCNPGKMIELENKKKRKESTQENPYLLVLLLLLLLLI